VSGETTCVSESHAPGIQSSEIVPRRAWQNPQVSTSLRSVAGAEARVAFPVAGSIVQAASARSSKRTTRPFESSVLSDGRQLGSLRAQATCREPCPWQVSHPTLISA